MANLDVYNSIFCETFNTSVESLNQDFSSSNVDMWDSVLQLTLVTQIEDSFDVMLEPEDIIEFKSYDLGKGILVKYGIEL
jgi:acyl carrier protein